MNQARQIAVGAEEIGASRRGVASWYSPGVSDPLGDRLLMFDNTAAASLELLRFKAEFGTQADFADALRRRVDQLARFSHPSIATARSIDWVEDDGGLALVSNHVPGRRLAEVLRDARGPSFAMELLRQIAPALSALRDHAEGIGHGALTPNRIVVTPQGRLVVVEHVVGPALARLKIPAHRLQRELGIPIPLGRDSLVVDARTDIVQLAVVALAVLVGRPVDPATYHERGTELLDEITWPNRHGITACRQLRVWLEHALQLNGRMFTTAREADDALMKLAEDSGPNMAGQSHTLHAMQAAAVPVTVSHHESRIDERDIRTGLLPPARPARRKTKWLIAALAALTIIEGAALAGLAYIQRSTANRIVSAAPPAVVPVSKPTPAPAPPATPAIVDGWLEIDSEPAGAKVTIDGVARGVTPLTMSVPPGQHTVVISDGTTTTTRTIRTAAGAGSTLIAALPAAAAGWLSISAPLELQIREAGNLLGITSADRVMMPAGHHNLEVVSAALGIQQRVSVDIVPGKTAKATVAVPNGSLSINAVPWANVWLDGQQLAGTTPFANLTVPVGTHELVYRHPDLGERRDTVVVTAKAPVRLVTNLRK